MIIDVFNNLRLNRKLLILYILSVFLPIVLTNIIFYQVTTNNVKEQKLHDISLVLQQIKSDFHESIDDAVGVSSVLYTDNKINEFLDKQYESTSDYVEIYDNYLRGFNKYGAIFSSVQAIHFYTDNPTVLYSGGVNELSLEVKQMEWYKTIPKRRNPYPIVIRTGTEEIKDTFSIIRELNYYKIYNSTKKFVKIDLSQDTIDHIFENVTFQGDVYLVNNQGGIEYSTNPLINWREELFDQTAIPIPEGAIFLEETYDNLNYLKDWKIVGVVSEQELLQEVQKSGLFILYLAIFNFLVPTLIIVFISNSLNFRIGRIVKHMKKMEDQHFETIDGIEYKDEIGQLTSEFNRMSNKIQELINNVYLSNIQKKTLELQKKQAQLSALQSQINPHFLFNALETIRMRSIIKHENETAKIIENMAKMLRRSFTWGRDWITVKEEMNVILSFLEIQKYRFEDKLHYQIDIEDSAYDYVIPNMILLPFVENASIHGIEPKKGKGIIRISIKRVENQYEFVIEDNGPGFSSEVLESLQLSLQNEEAISENVGIKNVYYRLKMYYGEQVHFEIHSEERKGTKVIIKLPIVNRN
jgi:two-component system, sensor histidine kinase YesM